jgi:hypothetical protein
VIGGYRPEGASLELILVGYYEKGSFLFAGKVRQALNPRTRKDLLNILKPLATSKMSLRQFAQQSHRPLGRGRYRRRHGQLCLGKTSIGR